MKLTWREALQLKKHCTEQTTTATNYFAGLEDGVQYKPKHHIGEQAERTANRARYNGRRFPQWI